MSSRTTIGAWIHWFRKNFFAGYTLRRLPPPDSAEHRSERQRWCRDHCGEIAEHWFGLGAVSWFAWTLGFQPGFWLGVGHPILAYLGLIGFVMGFFHLWWQIVAQSRVGPPKIEPPVEFRHEETEGSRDDSEETRFKA